jgi:alkylhydroperoxidase family enzyme
MPAETAKLLNKLPHNNITEMLAHAHPLTEPFLRMAQAQFTELDLSDRQRELVILAVSVLVECHYEYAQHVPIIAAAGIDADLRDRIRRGEFDAPDAPDERALLAFVAAVIRAPRISDDVFAEMWRYLSGRQIVETLQLVGFYWGVGRLATVLELELDVPDGLESITAGSHLGPMIQPAPRHGRRCAALRLTATADLRWVRAHDVNHQPGAAEADTADLEGDTETAHGRNLGAPYGVGRFRENHVSMGIDGMG